MTVFSAQFNFWVDCGVFLLYFMCMKPGCITRLDMYDPQFGWPQYKKMIPTQQVEGLRLFNVNYNLSLPLVA